MPLYKSVDFAKECGISRGVVSVNISRGKLIIGPKKMIDSAHPINAIFLEKYKKVKRSSQQETESKSYTPDPGKVARDAELKEMLAMEKEAKRLAMESKRKEQALLDAKLQKMHGVLIPTDMVKILFSQHFREVSTSFKQGIDGLLSEIGKKARLNGNQMAEIRGITTKIINECVNRAVDNSKKSVETVVNEYASNKNAA